MFLRKSVIEGIGVFDEGIFMYGEDTDLNRRIYRKYKTTRYAKLSTYTERMTIPSQMHIL